MCLHFRPSRCYGSAPSWPRYPMIRLLSRSSSPPWRCLVVPRRAGAPACLGDDEERSRLRRGRRRDRHPPRLDLRRHVLDLRDAGSRQQGEGQVHPRGAGAARRGQRHLAEGVRLLHARAAERQEGRPQRAGRLLSGIHRRAADAALHLAAQDAREGAEPRRRDRTIRPISSTSPSPRRSRCALVGAPAGLQARGRCGRARAARGDRRPARRGVLQQSRRRRAISARSSPTRSR